MTTRTQELLDEVLSLPTEERQDFLDRLYSAVEHEHYGFPNGETASAWDVEIAKRIEEIDSGKVKTIPAEEVRRRMDEIARKD
jgi:putative addiction module component (TIGR02574 family)